MSKIFNTLAKIQKVKQPLFQINRSRYRGVRVSEVENAETNLIKMDLTRIESQLNEIDASIIDNLEIFVGNKQDINLATNLDDGLSSVIDGIDIKFENISLEEDIKVDSIDKISGQVSRLLTKVSRLEKGN